MSLNQTDLDVRLQLTNCCIGNLTKELLNKIKLGAKDVDCKLTTLVIIEEMLEYLKCYDTNIINISSTGSLTSYLYDTSYICSMYIGDTLITSGHIDTLVHVQNLLTAFDTLTGYTTVLTNNGESYTISFTGDCDSEDVRFYVNNNKSPVTYTALMTGGLCNSGNCLTEVQVLAMFDWISTKCKLCFQYPGFSYE